MQNTEVHMEVRTCRFNILPLLVYSQCGVWDPIEASQCMFSNPPKPESDYIQPALTVAEELSLYYIYIYIQYISNVLL